MGGGLQAAGISRRYPVWFVHEVLIRQHLNFLLLDVCIYKVDIQGFVMIHPVLQQFG